MPHRNRDAEAPLRQGSADFTPNYIGYGGNDFLALPRCRRGSRGYHQRGQTIARLPDPMPSSRIKATERRTRE